MEQLNEIVMPEEQPPLRQRIFFWLSKREHYVPVAAGAVLVLVLCGAWAWYGLQPKHLRQTAVAPDVTPSASPSQSPTAPTPAAQTPGQVQGNATPLPYPSQVLGLSYFELTIPVASADTGNAAVIKQPQLAGYSSQYFATLANGLGVRFVSPVGGATTSGSQYPRSELREMANVGTEEASWPTTSGRHDMKLTESINHLPTAKPELVFAQIHGPSDDLIEAEITGKGGHNRLYVNHNGKQYGSDLDSNYVLGTKFNLEILASNGYVDVYYNGARQVHQKLEDSGDYFKAGCYTQSNPSKGDSPAAYGEVDIYSIKVTHT